MKNMVLAYINQYQLLEPQDQVIAAVSGGADSVCLLALLREIMPHPEASLRVLHVHHGLRGTEADRDEAYVRELCQRFSLSFASVHCDVAGFAREQKLSTEEAGRILRYQALEQAAAEWERETGKRTRIALAHHRGDSAETILHNLARGSGLGGLTGIRPQSGRLIRPLLCAGRQEILDYLKEQGLSWCEDSTNASPDYTRNRIRSRILPEFAESVNVRAEEHILQAGEIIAQADRYLREQAAAVFFANGSSEAGVRAVMDCGAFTKQPEILQVYLLRQMLGLVVTGQKDVSRQHFLDICALAKRGGEGHIDLPGGVRASVTGQRLLLETAAACESRTGKIIPHFCEQNVKMSHFPYKKGAEIPKNQYTKWFDYDKIKGTLFVRPKQEGDYITLAGGGRKSVSRYMIDEKIPASERGRIPLLAEDSHVLWIVGYRISEYYKVTENTKTVLQVQYDKGEDHGR